MLITTFVMICLQGACWCPFLSFLHRLASHLRDGSSGQTGRCRCALAAWKNNHETLSVADDLRTNHPPDSWVFPSFPNSLHLFFILKNVGQSHLDGIASQPRDLRKVSCWAMWGWWGCPSWRRNHLGSGDHGWYVQVCLPKLVSGRTVLIHLKNVLKKHIHISADPQVMDAWLGYSLVSLYMIIYRVAYFSDEVLPASKCFGSISFVLCTASNLIFTWKKLSA